jgi:hypothetical protein
MAEYTAHQFSVIDTAKQLAMFANGSGDCWDAALLRKWLEWRITDGWYNDHQIRESFGNAVKNLAKETILMYDNSWIKGVPELVVKRNE